jgi:NTE family protein
LSVAIVLSGGGTKGAFEVGAVRSLYDRGIRPDILCGCSVGALNAAKLAEGDGGLQGLEALWLSLRFNFDMWVGADWLDKLDEDGEPIISPQTKAFLLGTGTGAPFAPLPVFEPAGWGDLAGLGKLVHMGKQLSWLTDEEEGGREILELLGELQTAQSVYSLAPIASKLRAQLSVDKIRAWAQTGKKLRLATVGLESGRLRYVTETGQLVERDNTPVVIKVPAPQCRAIADAIVTLEQEVRSLQRQLQGAPTQEKASLIAEIRELGEQIQQQQQALAVCSSTIPPIAQPVPPVSLIDGALASASIPGVFSPVGLGSETYVDGGVREMLPMQAAIDLGADRIYGIAASKADVNPYPLGSFAQKSMLEIVGRSLTDIMPNETTLNEANPMGGWGSRTVKIIQPSVDLYEGLTVDPGLISIAMAYGYMRAADVDMGFKPDSRVWKLADDIATLRRDTWREECLRAGQPVPTEPGYVRPADPSLGPKITEKKQKLRSMIDERRSLSGALPANADAWPVQSERHPWFARTPVVSVTPEVIVLEQPIAITVHATERNAPGVQVAGTVSIEGQTVGNTNTPFTYTFMMQDRRTFDPQTKTWKETETPPTGKVLAAGYDAADIPFKYAGGMTDARFIRQSVPTTMVAGKQTVVSVTMRNGGASPWTSGGAQPYRLGSQNPQDNTTWGLQRVELPTSTIAPGQEVTFTFWVTAPRSPGPHNFQWRMLQEGISWFGNFTQNVIVNVIPAKLSVWPEPAAPMGRINAIIRAVDVVTEAPVAGTATIRNPDRTVGRFSTNTPFQFTFRMLRDIEADEWRYPQGSVEAPGYPPEYILFEYL